MLKFLLGFIVALIILTVLPLAFLGLIPGVSTLIGAGPKDLGIKITKADSLAAQKKIGVEIIPIKNGIAKEDFTLEGKRDVSITINSKELTAHSNNRPWKNYPMKNLQIKIYDDGTIESSGTLIVSKAIPYAMGLGYSEQQIKDAMAQYKIPSFEVPIYIKGLGSVTNDVVSVNAQTVRIGVFPIPSNIVAEANKGAEVVLEDIIKKHSDAFHADEVSFKNGKMTFIGQLPKKQYVITE